MIFNRSFGDNRSKAILITILCVILISTGQALMKIGFSRCTMPHDFEFTKPFVSKFLSSFISTPWILVGYSIAVISSIIYMEALHKAEFGVTSAIFSLNYVIAYFIGISIFKEAFNPVNLLGLILIFFGVVYISLAEGTKT